MANKRDVVRADLRRAQQIAAMARRNLQTAAPESAFRWEGKLKAAQAEVRRLERQLGS